MTTNWVTAPRDRKRRPEQESLSSTPLERKPACSPCITSFAVKTAPTTAPQRRPFVSAMASSCSFIHKAQLPYRGRTTPVLLDRARWDWGPVGAVLTANWGPRRASVNAEDWAETLAARHRLSKNRLVAVHHFIRGQDRSHESPNSQCRLQKHVGDAPLQLRPATAYFLNYDRPARPNNHERCSEERMSCHG